MALFRRNRLAPETSITAYGPLLTRWLMHKAGTRPDEAADRLVKQLPLTAPRLLQRLVSAPTRLMHSLGLPAIVHRYPITLPSSAATFLPHRTWFFDVAMRDLLPQVEQVVILGAGWDTRAYGLLEGAGVTIFEVDAPETQEVKRAALERAGIDTSEVVFVSADFNTESWLTALKRHNFNPSLPTFFLWEGVIYYLNPITVHATLATIATQCAPGSAIAFDYLSDRFINGGGSFPDRAAARIVKMLGEPLHFGIPTTPNSRQHLTDLLNQHNLTLARYEPLGKELNPFGGLALATQRNPTR